MHLYFVRHGETLLNARGVYYGATDTPLSAEGVAQAAAVGRHLAGLSWNKVYISNKLRTRQTARAIVGDDFAPCLNVVPELAELDFGQWEGLDNGAVRRQFPEDYKRWCNDWLGAAPTGGEAFLDFWTRVKAAFERIVEECQGTACAVSMGRDTVVSGEVGAGCDAVVSGEVGADCDVVTGDEVGAGRDTVAGDEVGAGCDAVAGDEVGADCGGQDYEAATAAHREKNILICAHNGTLRVIFAVMCGLGPEGTWHFNFEQDTWSRVDYEYGNFTIRKLNTAEPARAGMRGMAKHNSEASENAI